MSGSKLSLKLLIDEKTNKVLFAEAGKETVDFLFSILTLPVGTVINLLSKQGMVGCLANLYQSIESLNHEYVQDGQSKEQLLMPKVQTSIEVSPLFLLTNVPKKRKLEKRFYRCSNTTSTRRRGTSPVYYCDGDQYSSGNDEVHHYVTNDPGNVCPECRVLMNVEVPFVGPRKAVAAGSGSGGGGGGGGGGFVKGVVTYMVMDDLVVKPMSTISSIALLKKLNVKDVEAVEEKVVSLDLDTGLRLLKTAFQSKNVLTSVFLLQENSGVTITDAQEA